RCGRLLARRPGAALRRRQLQRGTRRAWRPGLKLRRGGRRRRGGDRRGVLAGPDGPDHGGQGSRAGDHRRPDAPPVLLAGRTPFLALALAALAESASAGEADWRTFVVEAGGRKLAAAVSARSGPVLTVVIEGDGAAHDADGRPAADPTPRRPTGLAIA